MFGLSYIFIKSLFVFYGLITTPSSSVLPETEVITEQPTLQVSPSPNTSDSSTPNPSPSPEETPATTTTPNISPDPILADPPRTYPEVAAPSVSSDLALLEEINSYRLAKGLEVFETDPTVCDFAKTRVQELVSDFSHLGFDERRSSNNLPYSSYSKVAENIADAGSIDKVMDLWKNSEGHNKNMLSDLTYACTANLNRMYVFLSWTP